MVKCIYVYLPEYIGSLNIPNYDAEKEIVENYIDKTEENLEDKTHEMYVVSIVYSEKKYSQEVYSKIPYSCIIQQRKITNKDTKRWLESHDIFVFNPSEENSLQVAIAFHKIKTLQLQQEYYASSATFVDQKRQKNKQI